VPSSPPIERVLKLTLGDGREASQVDELDTDAELSPRYFVRGHNARRSIERLECCERRCFRHTRLRVWRDLDQRIAGALTQNVSYPRRVHWTCS
jgi:hypothetical protein